MAGNNKDISLKDFRDAYDRLYTITKQLHDTFERGELTIKQGAFEEMIRASQSMLIQSDDLLKKIDAAAEASAEPAPKKPAVRKSPAKKAAAPAAAAEAAEPQPQAKKVEAPEEKPAAKTPAPKAPAKKPATVKKPAAKTSSTARMITAASPAIASFLPAINC